jgi:hypothetical protein
MLFSDGGGGKISPFNEGGGGNIKLLFIKVERGGGGGRRIFKDGSGGSPLSEGG